MALVEVEAHIHERFAADTGGIDESQLIEAHLRTILAIELLGILLGDQSGRYADGRMAEQTDTGGVRGDGRNISTKCFHRSTHTHRTGCTIQVVHQQTTALIRILCSYRQNCCQGECCYI